MGEHRRLPDHVLAVVGSAAPSGSRIAAISQQPAPAVGCPRRAKASRRPSAVSAAAATSPSAPIGASSTSHAPSGRLAKQRASVSVASLVFPEPPGPIKVVHQAGGNELADRGDVSVLADEAGRSARRSVVRVISSPLPELAPQQRDVHGGQPRRGVDAQLSARVSLVRWNASSASVSRPAAARARISAATSRSRSGCAATRSVSSVTSPAPWPRLISASDQSSSAVRRSPSSRVTAASNAALFRQSDVLVARAVSQCERLAQPPRPLGASHRCWPGAR